MYQGAGTAHGSAASANTRRVVRSETAPKPEIIPRTPNRLSKNASATLAPPTAPAHAPVAFRATSAPAARSLTDCAQLANGVLMPWVGFGTYKLGASTARKATLEALKCGYRSIDTAFIYAGEKCEPEVGKAVQAALAGTTWW